MRNEIEDLLFYFKDKAGIEITFEDMDAINGTVSGYCQGQEAMRMQVDLSFWGATACCKSYNLRM